VNTEHFDIGLQVSNIEANRSVKDALMTRLQTRRPPRRISVTDLLSLKQAYFRRKHPEIVPPLERQQLMWAGTGFHDIFGAAVSSEEYIEQLVELHGVVGRIDIYEKVPIEVKTTSNLGEEADLRRKRPGYIEQLGMYCGMVDVGEGKIVVYQREAPPESPLPLAVYDVRFSDLEAIREEMVRRRSLLEEALASDDPTRLPRCPWYRMQCDYSSVCDCGTTATPTSYTIAGLAIAVDPDMETAQKLLAKLGEQRPVEALHLNDIVFPRKAYFARLQREAVVDQEAVDFEEAKEALTSMDRRGFVGVVRDALETGAPGEAQRIPANLGELNDRVLLHQGVPTIVRTPSLRSVVERDRLPELFPHYLLRLGFECALSDNPRGRLVLYYRNVQREDAKLLVYDVSFRHLDNLKAEALRRIDLVQKARRPEELPPCPAWMARYCKYAPACGCGREGY
jgi:hypothetical protein